MSEFPGTFPHFRLDFEQQQTRAKELLRASRAGEPSALQRLAGADGLKPGATAPKLADAQRAIARELRFGSWAELKRHLGRMHREREAMSAPDARSLDADQRTLHVRCGSDLKVPLREAGFSGDFYEHNYPYLIGPVREGLDSLEERARFIAETYGGDFDVPLCYEHVLVHIEDQERLLLDSAAYERVVIWSELDCYDQLVLVRLLGHYATHPRPRRLELLNVADHPGGVRFIGLGQLPPESLRMLWPERRPATEAQLELGLAAWRALASQDPRDLADIARTDTPDLPLLAPALHRHLRELPSATNGLSFTEQMALAMLAEGPHSLNRVFARMTWQVDPLPGQGDSQVRDRVLAMEGAREPVFTRAPGLDGEGRSRPPWTDVLTITDLGRRVLAGEVDFRSLAPQPRWVGGVRVAAGEPDWRWDEAQRQAVRFDQ